jgi:hypothetical protein
MNKFFKNFLGLIVFIALIFIQGSLVYSGDNSGFNTATVDTLRPPCTVFYVSNQLTHITFYPNNNSKTVDLRNYPILKIPVDSIKIGKLPVELAFKVKSGESGDYATICTKTFDISKIPSTLTVDFRSNDSLGYQLGWAVKKMEAFTLQNPCNPGGINLDNEFVKFYFGKPFFIRPIGFAADSIKTRNK